MPITWLFLLLGLVAGVLFGSAAVLLAEMVDDRLNTPTSVEQRLGLPYLGGVPILTSARGSGPQLPLDVVVSRPRSAFSEALRGLLASVTLAGPSGDPGVILVTSARARDGKTTIAAGLARTASLQGLSTVLVDCDAQGRGRGLMRDFKIAEWGPGLIEVLNGEADIADALRQDEDSGGWLLPMSDNPQPADDLLGGQAMDALLARLRRTYRAVILDGPALPIATSRVLAAKADLTLIVMEWRSRVDGGLMATLRLPPFDQARRVGVSLNRIDMAQQARYGLADPESFRKRFSNEYA
jgi:Mrp family chromosome partitioning ATPase